MTEWVDGGPPLAEEGSGQADLQRPVLRTTADCTFRERVGRRI